MIRVTTAAAMASGDENSLRCGKSCMVDSIQNQQRTSAGTANSTMVDQGVVAASGSAHAIPAPLLSFNPDLREPTDDDQSLGVVMEAMSSAAAVSMFSSMTFHLAAWGIALVVLPLLGIDWLEQLTSEQPPLRASLGDEEIIDQLAFVEINTRIDGEMTDGPTSLEQMARELQQSESGWLHSAVDNIWQNQSDDDNQESVANTGNLLRIPESGLAVTKGSFTAFTIPAAPQPLQRYSIIIEIRLPDDVKRYRVADLTGEVRGTDNYKQNLPWDSDSPLASGYPTAGGKVIHLKRSSVLEVENNRVQIIIQVPGARKLVKDVITIKSRQLREEQELELVFGRRPGSTN